MNESLSKVYGAYLFDFCEVMSIKDGLFYLDTSSKQIMSENMRKSNSFHFTTVQVHSDCMINGNLCYFL